MPSTKVRKIKCSHFVTLRLHSGTIGPPDDRLMN